MNITLKRVSYSKYDELMDLIDIDVFFDKNKNKIYNEIENFSDPVLYNNGPINISINLDEYYDAVKESSKKGESSAKISKLLYRDFTLNGTHLPDSIMYEKEIWTYLNFKVFFDLIKIKFINEDIDDDKLIGKIKRYYFNDGGLSKIDRTGLRYLWVLADILETKRSDDLIDIAIEFSDPFKAIQECVLGKNPIVLKAYALAIRKLNCDPRIKKPYFKTLIPKHLRNHACSNFYDGYSDPNQLAELIAEQIKLILNNYSVFNDIDDDPNINV